MVSSRGVDAKRADVAYHFLELGRGACIAPREFELLPQLEVGMWTLRVAPQPQR